MIWVPYGSEFRWLSGMVCCSPDDYDEEAPPQYPVIISEGSPHYLCEGRLTLIPDDFCLVDSPATRGALLSLVRERFPHAYVSVRVDLKGRVHYDFESGEPSCHFAISADSEFFVLTSALNEAREDSGNTNLMALRAEMDAISRMINQYTTWYSEDSSDTYIAGRMNALFEKLEGLRVHYNQIARATRG